MGDVDRAARQVPVASLRVLVVDDDPSISRLVTAALAPVGYSIETSMGGRDAIVRIQRWHPHVILLDFGMPEGNGWVVSNFLRALGRHVPIVVMSGVSDAAEWAEEISASAFLAKPFS